MLKVWERLPRITPEVFAVLSREEQVLLLVYAQERDLEELEQRVGNLGLGEVTG